MKKCRRLGSQGLACGRRDDTCEGVNHVLRLEPDGVLYVRQKQWAVTYPGDTLDNGQKVGEQVQKTSVVLVNLHLKTRCERLYDMQRQKDGLKDEHRWLSYPFRVPPPPFE